MQTRNTFCRVTYSGDIYIVQKGGQRFFQSVEGGNPEQIRKWAIVHLAHYFPEGQKYKIKMYAKVHSCEKIGKVETYSLVWPKR